METSHAYDNYIIDSKRRSTNEHLGKIKHEKISKNIPSNFFIETNKTKQN